MANRRFIDFPIAASVGNNDIVLIWQDGLNKQTTKATLLQGSPQSLAGLTDVDISALTNGQILQYNSTLGKWENVDRTDINLSELGDVTIVAPANGQVLVYNSSTGKWENSSAGYVPYTGAVTTVNLGAQSILAGSFVKAGGTAAQFLKANGSVDSTAYGTGSVTSVALTMPTAFSVAGSPITTAGTLAVTGAGTVGQYIRGDGSLADFPATTGGGSSVSYYLNGSVSQGTIGGVAYKELNRAPVFGAGTDITINANGYIASFITDALDPNKLLIPAGNWNFETYFSASSNGGSPSFYVELYKYDGSTFTLIASSSAAPELIAFGTNLNPYYSTLAVPETVLALTDRLALRYYVTHSGRTITLHTENNHLCQVITTFTTGLTALNGITSQVQYLTVGTSGTDFAISSASDTHTFNLPTASATNRGALSSADWTTFNGKQNALTNPVTGTGTTNYLPKFTGASAIGNSQIFDNGTTVGIATTALVADALLPIQINAGVSGQAYFASNNNGNYGLLMGYDNFNGYARIRNVSNTALTFETNNTQKMRLDKDGNLGLGVNSSAWSQFKSLEIGTTGNGISGFIGASSTVMQTNAYWNGTNWIYANTANSAQIEIQGGNIIAFKQAASGTAGTSITYTQPFIITSGGNTLIGNPPSDNGAKLQINGFGTISSGFQISGGPAGYGGAELVLNSVSGALNAIYTNGGGSVVMYFDHRGTSNTGSFVFRNGTGAGNTLLSIASTGASTFLSSITAGASISIGSSGPYVPGVLYSDANWGMILKAKQASPVNANFMLTSATDVEQMRFYPDGNLHIGPSASNNGARLQVSGTGTFTSSIVAVSAGLNGSIANSGDAAILTIKQSSTSYNNGIYLERGGERNGYHIYIGGAADSLTFRRNYFGTQSDVMSLTRDGNILLANGTDTGGVRLQVAPSASTWISGTFAGTGGTNKVVIGNFSGAAAIGAHSAALDAWANLAINFGGGNVLIGTTTGGASKLRIVGLPTSAVGLSSGDVYNLAGTLMIA